MQSFHRIFLLLASLAASAGLSTRSIGQDLSDGIDLQPFGELYFDSNTKELVAEDGGLINYGMWILQADSIRYDQEDGNAIANGNVILTRGDLRMIATSLDFRPSEQWAHIEDFRIGNGTAYIDGALFEGNPNNFRFRDTNFHPGEPGTFLFKARIEEFAVVEQNELQGRKLRFNIGAIPVFLLPSFAQPLDAETNLIRPDLDYSGHIGGSIGAEALFPVADNVRLGANIALTSKRGILAGPIADYNWTDNRGYGNGSFSSGFIDDSATAIGNDIHGLPIDDERYFAEWKHFQRFGERVSINAYARYWSDSEVTRDFFEESFDTMQDPDTYFETNYTHDNWQTSLFARASLNDFQRHTERLPEFRFDYFPTTIVKGLTHRGSLSLAKLESFDETLESDTSVNRADAYYGLEYNKSLHKDGGANLRLIAGARATHYDDTDLILGFPTTTVGGAPTFDFDNPFFYTFGGTQTLGEFGADLRFKFSREFDTRSDSWNIDGIRHIVEPIFSYRRVYDIDSDPLSTVANPYQDRPIIDSWGLQNFLAPIDLADRRNIDTLGEEDKLRFELRNRIQTRDGDYGSRDLLRFGIAAEHYFDAEYADRDLSFLHTDLLFIPAPWIEARLFSRYLLTESDFESDFGLEPNRIQETNASISITDPGYWKIGFGTHFLAEEIEQYFAFGELDLSERWKIYGLARYDEKSSSFYEQRIGLRQRAIQNYAIEYELRFYEGPRRESDFGISIGVDLFND